MDTLLTTTCGALRKSWDRFSEEVFAPGTPGTIYEDRVLKLDVLPSKSQTTVYIDSPISAGMRTPGAARGDRRCSICGSVGHDKRNCKKATPLDSSPGSGRHCSICGSTEHDRRKCPTVLRGEQKQDALVALVTSPVTRRAATLSAGIAARVNDLTAARLFFEERGETTKKIVRKATTVIDRLTMERADLVFGAWLVTHLKWPFPSHREAVTLGLEAGQSFRATSTWFTRARRDLRRYARQNTPGHTGESGWVYSSLLVRTPLTSVPPTPHTLLPSKIADLEDGGLVSFRGADADLSAFAHADTLVLLECWMGQSLRRQEGHVAAGVVGPPPGSPIDVGTKRGAEGLYELACGGPSRGRKRFKLARVCDTRNDNGGDAGGDAA